MFTLVEGIIWVMDDRPRPQKIMQTSAFNLPRVRYSARLTQSSTLREMLPWTAAGLCTFGFWGLRKSDTDVTRSRVPCVLNTLPKGASVVSYSGSSGLHQVPTLGGAHFQLGIAMYN